MAIVGRRQSQVDPLLQKPTVTNKKQEEECKKQDKKLATRTEGESFTEEEEEEDKPRKSAGTAELAEEDEKPKKGIRAKAKKVTEEAERSRKRRGRKRAEAVEVMEQTTTPTKRCEASAVEDNAERPTKRRARESALKTERYRKRIAIADKVVEDADTHRPRERVVKIHEKPKKRAEFVKVGLKSKAESVKVMEEHEIPRRRAGNLKVMAQRLGKLGAMLKIRGEDVKVRRRREAGEVPEEYAGAQRVAESVEVPEEDEKPRGRREAGKRRENDNKKRKEKPTTRTGAAEILKSGESPTGFEFDEKDGNLKDVKVEVFEEKPGKPAKALEILERVKPPGKKIIRIMFTDPYLTESSTDEEEIREKEGEREAKSYLYEVKITQIDDDCYPPLQKIQKISLQRPPVHKNEQFKEVGGKKEEKKSTANGSEPQSQSEDIKDCFLCIPGPMPNFDIPMKDVYHHLLLN